LSADLHLFIRLSR